MDANVRLYLPDFFLLLFIKFRSLALEKLFHLSTSEVCFFFFWQNTSESLISKSCTCQNLNCIGYPHTLFGGQHKVQVMPTCMLNQERQKLVQDKDPYQISEEDYILCFSIQLQFMCCPISTVHGGPPSLISSASSACTKHLHMGANGGAKIAEMNDLVHITTLSNLELKSIFNSQLKGFCII